MGFSSDQPQLTNQLPLSIDFPLDPVENQYIQTSAYKQTVDAMNTKEGGLYLLQEIAAYTQFFPNTSNTNSSQSLTLRSAYRTTFDLVAMFGAPIPVGTTTIPLLAEQLIVGIFQPTSLRGAATITGPKYVSLISENADCVFDNTNPNAQVIVVTNNYPSAYTQSIFIFEYLKN